MLNFVGDAMCTGLVKEVGKNVVNVGFLCVGFGSIYVLQAAVAVD